MFVRFAAGLGPFLRAPVDPAGRRERLLSQLAHRQRAFVTLLRRAVYDNPRSPYRRLLQHAGFSLADVESLIASHGVEATLHRLHDAGVYVSLDEFKGRAPIVRGSFRLPVAARDFDNPLAAEHFETTTTGSRGRGARLVIDLDLLAYEAEYLALVSEVFRLGDRPVGLWRPAPPGFAGMAVSLRRARLGKPVDRWFSQNRPTWSPGMLKAKVFTEYAIRRARLTGRPFAAPEHVPLARAVEIAGWLEGETRRGTPALLATSVSCGVRVALAAAEHGIDISGTFMQLGGEPLTLERAGMIRAAGCECVATYAMTECGYIGLPCGAGSACDDVHLMSDKVAVLQHGKQVGPAGIPVGTLYLTSLLPACTRIMLNVETGDYGVLEERDCGCPLGDLGLRAHLHTIRSYDKLTSEGMCFLGCELIDLLESDFPSLFGGRSTDYQFVEEDEGGLPRVSIYVSPRIGEIDEAKLVGVVHERLHAYPGAQKMMAEVWRQGRTLRVVRKEPLSAAQTKLLPLHVLDGLTER